MSLFDDMVAGIATTAGGMRENAVHEAMQQVALAGLARGGFFEKAAFYGGTCLHFFHGLRRFSEDLDFSLLGPDPDFRFEDYFDAVREEFHLAGRDVEIQAKRKVGPSDIECAFLKEASTVYDIGFTSERRVKAKLEVDVSPPLGFKTEMQLLMHPVASWIRTFDLPGLYAGKMHAVLFREWRSRVKGRDWYDLAWYVGRNAVLDLGHLAARAADTHPGADFSTPEALRAALLRRIGDVDFKAARSDVLPFIEDPRELDIWSREYFTALAMRVRTE